jgi:hypothetical protein
VENVEEEAGEEQKDLSKKMVPPVSKWLQSDNKLIYIPCSSDEDVLSMTSLTIQSSSSSSMRMMVRRKGM